MFVLVLMWGMAGDHKINQLGPFETVELCRSARRELITINVRHLYSVHAAECLRSGGEAGPHE